jgi:hypothetical protein
MSQFPRIVVAGVPVDRDGGQTFIKAGSVVDIVPGSELESAYGGSGNLSAVISPSDPVVSFRSRLHGCP